MWQTFCTRLFCTACGRLLSEDLRPRINARPRPTAYAIFSGGGGGGRTAKTVQKLSFQTDSIRERQRLVRKAIPPFREY